MGLSYYYKFLAPAQKSASELETFLQKVETEAKILGFRPTMVLHAVFDTDERRQFARRLTTGEMIESEKLRGTSLGEGQVWSHDTDRGECRLIPQEGVLLVITDESGNEQVFGFFKYPENLMDIEGNTILKTGFGGSWTFRDHTKTPDPRLRQLVKKFAKEGYLAEERDDFAAA